MVHGARARRGNGRRHRSRSRLRNRHGHLAPRPRTRPIATCFGQISFAPTSVAWRPGSQRIRRLNQQACMSDIGNAQGCAFNAFRGAIGVWRRRPNQPPRLCGAPPTIYVPTQQIAPASRRHAPRIEETIRRDGMQLLARRCIPSRRIVVHAAVAHAHAIDEGITQRSAALNNSAAHDGDVCTRSTPRQSDQIGPNQAVATDQRIT
jgi:hypothetical protein